MSSGSTIEWTEATWSPVTGCSRVSEGCRHCYAETISAIERRCFLTRGVDDERCRTIAEICGLLIHVRDNTERARGLARAIHHSHTHNTEEVKDGHSVQP